MRTAALLSFLLLPLAACDTTGVDQPGYELVGTFDIDPNGTYLRTNNDPVNAPTTIDLERFDVRPGDSIYVRILGEVDLDPSTGQNGQPGASTFTTLGVFSSSATLLAPDQRARVPGAIDVGEDIVTGPTGIGQLPTDIPEDTIVNRGQFRVPAGATTLFLGTNDLFYSDNEATTYTATLTVLRDR